MADIRSRLFAALTSEEITPDVLPSDYAFEPTVFFSLVWPESGTVVTLGDTIAKSLTASEPQIALHPSANLTYDDTRTYTLVMTDPDAPSRADPKFREFRHWIITGVTLPPSGNLVELEGVYATKPSSTLTAYYPPGPPPGTGLHRYVFLLFEEPQGGVSIPSGAVEHESQKELRRSWKAVDFAMQYNLKLVGANFFLTEAEESG